MFKEAQKVINSYRNKPHVRGQRDCNLMILKIFDKENYEKMKGHYTTLIGGARVSSRVYGVKSMYGYLNKSGFQVIPKGFERPLDVIAFKGTHNVYLCLGAQWFGVGQNETFGVVSPEVYDPNDYVIFRKGKN